jgi:hypothetical protein
MTPGSIELLQLAVSGIAVPLIGWVLRLLWKLERRLLKVELKLGIDTQES